MPIKYLQAKLLTCLACALAALTAPAASADEVFLIPGIDLASARLQVGAWCRYWVIDEAMGEIDTAAVYIAVSGERAFGEETAYWVEVENRPLGGDEDDREVSKLLISSKINEFQPGDSLYHYVIELYIRKGSEPAEPADPEDLKRLSLSNPTSDSTWTLEHGVDMSTPMGVLSCDYKQLTVENERRIPMGSAELVKKDRDEFEVWTAHDVPLFSLVRCVITRTRDSHMVPAMRGIPDTGSKGSRTTVELRSFGDDAQTLF